MKKFFIIFFPCVAALACILFGNILIALFPVPIQISKTEKTTTIQVDGVRKDVKTTSDIKEIHFTKPHQYEREFQIDGSDSITYNTFDKNYFATFSAHPYYHFQSFLRNETTYNQLTNGALLDKDKKVIQSYQQVDGKTISVPATFTLSLDLRRPEKSRRIDIVYNDKSTMKIDIDRITKRVTIERQDNKGKYQVAAWYFPFGSEPFLAEIIATLLNATALALLLMAILPILAWYMPRWKMNIQKPAYLPLLFWFSISGMIMASCYISIVLFNKSPYILDGASYYFQGKVIAQGMWTATIPTLKDAFPIVFFTTHANQWFSTFPPGTALLLAPGFLLNVPWLVEIVLAALTAVLIFLIGEKLYNRTIGTVALVLFASSPFVHLQAASFLSHVPALFVATLATYIVLLYLDKPKKRFLIVGSLLLGLSGLIREFTPIIYGLALGVFITIQAFKKYGVQNSYRHLLLALLFGIIGISCYFLFYNFAYTGSFMDIPRHIASHYDKWGFGRGIGFYGEHTLASGLANTDQQITSFIIYVFGWPYYFAIAFLFIPFITRQEKPADYLSLSLIIGYIVAYIGAFYHGIAFGPRHYFEMLPGVVFLTARGFIILAKYTGEVLHGWHRAYAFNRAAYATGLVFVLLMLCNFFYFEPRLFQVHKNFADIPGNKDLRVDSIFNDTVSGRRAKVTDAVIMTDSWLLYNTYFSYLNCPRLNCPTIYALAKSDKERTKLVEMYHGRMYYTVKQKGNQLVLEPFNTDP